MAQTTKRKEPSLPTPKKQIQKLPPKEDQSAIEEFPLRQIAANFISENEKDGLAKLDAFTEQIYNRFAKKYADIMVRAAWLVGIGGFLLIIAVIADRINLRYGDFFALIGLCCGAGGCLYLLSWRNFQYGSLPLRKPCEAIYDEVDKDIATNLDKLFEVLQSGIAPRAYYKKNGSDRSLDQKSFYGRLRFLLLSPHKTYRELVFRHTAVPWFSHEIFMRVNIKALLQKTNAKPDKRQKSDKYDSRYKRLLLLIIEHPALRQIIPGRRNDATKLNNLIKSLSDADSDEQDKDFDKLTPENLRCTSLPAKFWLP